MPAETTSSTSVQRLVLGYAPAVNPGRGSSLRPGGEVWVSDDGEGLASSVVERLASGGFRARLIGPDVVVSPPERLDGLVVIAPTVDGDHAVKAAFRLIRAAGPALLKSAENGGALLATVTRLGGTFGVGGIPVGVDPATGGLAGLLKTAGHEWPGVFCRAIDLAPTLEGAAGLLCDELLRRGPVEVGLSPAGRTVLTLDTEPTGGASVDPIGPGDLVVITGGARGVTAEVAVALAGAFRPSVVLFGRSPAPGVEADGLAGLSSEADIKRALAARANGRATPQKVAEEYRALAAGREIAATLDRLSAAGATASYRQVDARDPSAVLDALDAARAEFGPVRGLVHGAGVLADRRIADKTDAQFDAVYDTKVAGLRALVDAIPADELRVLALFSSSTARFGRTGQVAYAAANEALNKFAQREAGRRPGCRVVSLNWGPWDGGMVTPALKAVFASEGIGLIPLREGAQFLVDELRSQPEAGGRAPVELVILGGDSLPEGLAAPALSIEPTEPAVEAAVPVANLTVVFERPLDPSALPVLRDHVIDGRGVLPMALTLEWLAQGALQRNPGLALCGLDDLRLLKGAVFHDERPETLQVLVGKATKDGPHYRVPVELRGVLISGKSVAHARGEVVLGDRPPSADRLVKPPALAVYGRSPRSIYHDVLFHGPLLQGIERVDGLSADGIEAVVKAAALPSAWVARPLRQAWLTDPLALDCAFQLLSLWCHEQTGAASLPTKVGRYRQFRRVFPQGKVRVLASVTRPAEHRASADIEFLDADNTVVARIEGYECVIDASLNQAFRRNRLTTPRAVPSPG